MAGALADWERYDKNFVLAVQNEGAFVIRQKNIAFNETFRLEPLVERSRVLMFRVLGYAQELQRSRPLGFLLLHSGKPLVSHYYTYVAVCYSEPAQIGAKEISTLYTDPDVVFLKVGFEDYFFGWRRPTREHTKSGSGGSVHRDQDGAWKDGF